MKRHPDQVAREKFAPQTTIPPQDLPLEQWGDGPMEISLHESAIDNIMRCYAANLEAIQVKKLTDDAVIPTKANKTDAGFDLYSLDNVTLRVGARHLFKVGISMAIPDGYYGSIRPRSGLAYKHGIDTMAGVIDSSYRGEIGVILVNHGTVWHEIKKGDRIAQLVIEKIGDFGLMEVEELDATERGDGGFGSSGS